jgi:hypothetical protein
MTDAEKLFQSLAVANTWYIVLISFGIGAVGGLAHALGDTGSVPVIPPTPGAPVTPAPPDKWKWLREVLVGAVAAVAVLFVVRPADGVALVSSSLIAGYAGRAIMAALEDKAKAIIAQQAAVVAQQRANDATQDVHKLIDAADKAKSAGTVMGGQPPAPSALDGAVEGLKRKYGMS